jgi:ribosomal protein S18 acetylase RimI-like enzyme
VLVLRQKQEERADLERFERPKVGAEVIVRLLEEKDCAAVIDIWLSGLKQTSMSFPALSRHRRRMAVGLEEYGRKATQSADGDMNPVAILAEWAGRGAQQQNKAMFVAHAGGVVVGLCGVCRGCTQGGDDADEAIPKNTFSLWRMSVSPTARRMGVATKLCDAVEAFARKAGGSRMRCITANPLAAAFYHARGFEVVIPHFMAPWYEKAL